MEAEHAEAIQKITQELGSQIEEMKKRDFDMQAANKILKKQAEQSKATLKTKDQEVEVMKEKYEKTIKDMIQSTKHDREKQDKTHQRKIELSELSKIKALKDAEYHKKLSDRL